jgi:hypothetical protein
MEIGENGLHLDPALSPVEEVPNFTSDIVTIHHLPMEENLASDQVLKKLPVTFKHV